MTYQAVVVAAAVGDVVGVAAAGGFSGAGCWRKRTSLIRCVDAVVAAERLCA